MKTSAAAGALIGLLVLTSCGSSGSGEADEVAIDEPTAAAEPSPTAADGSMPTSVAPPTGQVLGIGTVLEAAGEDSEPQLCLGPVAESAPPQCEGPPLTGWSWEEVPGTNDARAGARWGTYAVTGTYDGTGFSVTEAPQTLALYDAAGPDLPERFVTPCPTPEGGWAVVDQTRIGYADQDAAVAQALQLPGYSGSFLTPLKSAADTTRAPENAARTILNVLVTEDVEGARTRLEAIWGGPLCVAEAERSEQDLLTIQDDLIELPGLLTVGVEVDLGTVRARVLWDDGSLQEWADTTYGDDLVVIESALEPVS